MTVKFFSCYVHFTKLQWKWLQTLSVLTVLLHKLSNRNICEVS